MKQLNNMWFGLILTLSILAVVWCFGYADYLRGYNATGGEVFMVALPILVVSQKVSELGRKIKYLKKYNGILQKHI